ncbi:MAG: type II toxin-antitoxin system prevent-host-death family antitoxin [Candidatus Omnitrophica bacterium]|nr:type II toxin-antitoxin system prevent-host-death family antitoxin [Candidatus Omnitrophota bacterium]
MIITAGKFKAGCLRIMDDVQKHHREVIITKYGRPVAKLVGVDPQIKNPLFGFLKDTVVIKGEIISPISESWDVQ